MVFTLGSIGCSLVQSLPQLVLARVRAGDGRRDDGAGRPPRGAADDSEGRARLGAWPYLTVPALIGPVIGPPLGGFIVTYFHWRWIFLINMPIGVLGLVLATRFIPNIARDARRRSTGSGSGS